MDDAISKLTAAQALKLVERLGRKGGKIREAVLTEAMNVLAEIDVGETANEVIAALESIDVQDCWDRSGNSRDGYTSPEEAAAEIIEEELQPLAPCSQFGNKRALMEWRTGGWPRGLPPVRRTAGYQIIARQRNNSAHLHGPWRAS